MKSATNNQKTFFHMLPAYLLVCCTTLYTPAIYTKDDIEKSSATPIHKYLQPIQIAHTASGIEGIDCLYCCSTLNEQSKKSNLFSSFTRMNLNVNYIFGRNGYTLSEDEKRELEGPYLPNLRGTQISNLVTHLSILHDANKRFFQRIWIMTDNVQFVGDIQHIPTILDELTKIDPEWDVLYTDTDSKKQNGSPLESTYYNPRPEQTVPLDLYSQPKKKVSDSLMRIHRRCGTHSMIISKKGIKKIIDYYAQFYLWAPLDEDLHYIPKIREYSTTYDIVTNETENNAAEISLQNHIAIVANWDLRTFPSQFETVRKKYNITIFYQDPFYHTPALPENLDSFQKIIIFNPYFNVKKIAHIPKENLILFVWEPEILPTAFYDYFGKVYTWDDTLVDNKQFFKFYYPEYKTMSSTLLPFEQKKLATIITSHWTPHRVQVLEFFTAHSGELEVYSRSCPKDQFSSLYKGSIPGHHSGAEKLKVLQQYRFCFCSENTLDLQGYVTEKIFDCFAAGCVPIYRGASNIESYIPKKCFIDARNFASIEEIYHFIKNMTQETYNIYIQNIREYLASEQATLFSKENFDKIMYEAVSQ